MQTILFLLFLGCLALLMYCAKAVRWVLSMIRFPWPGSEASLFLASLKHQRLLNRWLLNYAAGRHNGGDNNPAQ